MAASDASVLVAAIDLGTNAFRLLIAEATPDRRVVPRHIQRAVPRLGEGMSATGRLCAAAVERALDALREFRDVMRRYPVQAVVVVATSAVREAANAKDFLDRVQTEFGFGVEVISGEEEARRTWLGVQAGFSQLTDSLTEGVVLDIGGGSTEVIRIRHGRFDRALSLDLGVVKLRERFIHHDPPLQTELFNLESEIRRTIEPVASLCVGMGPCAVIGTAGTVTTAATLYLKLGSYDPSRLHGTVVPRAALEDIAARLATMTTEERRNLPTLERGREDVIVAGMAILRLVLDTCGAEAIQVSENGLREGLIVDWMARRRASLLG